VTVSVLTRPEALKLAQSKGFEGTGQNLYDWSKAALNGKTEQSRESNRQKLAKVGLKAVSNNDVTAWQKLTP